MIKKKMTSFEASRVIFFSHFQLQMCWSHFKLYSLKCAALTTVLSTYMLIITSLLQGVLILITILTFAQYMCFMYIAHFEL